MTTIERQLANARDIAQEQQYRISELADNIAALRGALRETDDVNATLRERNQALTTAGVELAEDNVRLRDTALHYKSVALSALAALGWAFDAND